MDDQPSLLKGFGEDDGVLNRNSNVNEMMGYVDDEA